MSTLVYDGDCAFCTSSVRTMARLHLGADTVVAWQHADLDALGLTQQQCEDKLQWVGDRGIRSGHEAVAEVLRAGPRLWHVPARLLVTPPISWLAARVYAWVSAHRSSLPGGTPACSLPADQRPPAQRPG